LDQNNSDAILNECTGTTNTTWYNSFSDATDSGAITKIVVKTNKLVRGKTLALDIHNNAVARRLDGTLNSVDTIAPNYTAIYEDILYARDSDHWVVSEKILDLDNKGCTSRTDFLDKSADRICLNLAFPRVTQDQSTQEVEYGDEVNVSIHSTYTVDSNETIEDNITIVSILSQGKSYIVGSSSMGEPTIVWVIVV